MGKVSSNKTQGIIMILLAGFFFSLMTFFVRLSGDLPTMQKAFFRNIVAAVVSTIVLLRSDEGLKIQKSSWGDLAVRCIFGTSGVICNFYAIDHLNIADANMLNKLSPFFAVVISAIILKEKANSVEWTAVAVAFAGAMLIIKPSFKMEAFYGLMGAFGGLGAGIAYTFVRKLGKKGERGTVIVMCFSVFSCIVTLPFMLADYHHMEVKQLVYLLLAGAAGMGGQFTITRAYSKAPAKEISVFDYSQIIFAALLGMIFLGQVPDIYSIFGYIIIIGTAVAKWYYSCIYLEKRKNTVEKQ